MTNTLNDIENETVSLTSNNNYIVNDKYARAKRVEEIADQLVEKFKSTEYRGFFCKVAWKLSEARIWSNYEQAIKGKQPGRLFSYLCKRDGV